VSDFTDWIEVNLPPTPPDPVAEFNIFPVKKEAFVQRPQFPDHRATQQHKGSPDPFYFSSRVLPIPPEVLQIGPMKETGQRIGQP